jgi:hypothetical protein
MRFTRFGLFSLVSIALGAFSGVSAAATFTVTSTGDAGAGTLRQTIEDANAAGGTNTIKLKIVG